MLCTHVCFQHIYFSNRCTILQDIFRYNICSVLCYFIGRFFFICMYVCTENQRSLYKFVKLDARDFDSLNTIK